MNRFRSVPRWVGSVIFILLLFSLAAPVRAEITIDAARVKEIAAWLPAKATGLGRPVTDRAAWEKLAKLPAFASLIGRAQTMAKEPVPVLTDELFLDFSKTGNRDRCQHVLFARSSRVVTLTLAECLENQGRFLEPLTDTLKAVCAEKTWVYPAHDGRLDNFYGRTVEMDLRATAVGWELANVDYLLGAKLSADTRQMLLDNLERRVLQPYRDMAEGRRKEISWMRATHNWNAVCVAGVTGAALAIEDKPDDRAWFIAAAQDYIRYSLKGFPPDGYCVEGMGYWNYGFGHFLMLGETIRLATARHIDLLADPAALQPALYPARDEILSGIYPTIADCHPGSRPDPQFVCLIDQRLGLPGTDHCGDDFVRPNGSLPDTLLFSFLELPLPLVPHPSVAADSPLRTWFKDAGVLISRSAPGAKKPFAVCIKAGSNSGNHHHVDTGSFSVICGGSMVICDPGGEVYTKRTFSAHRLDSKVLNSYGHAVPVVAGQLETDGAQARAVVEQKDFAPVADTLTLDITSAYAVPELKRLERTFTYRRDNPSLTVRDSVTFREQKTFETALITWATWKQASANELLLTDTKGSARVKIDTDGAAFKIKAEEINEDVTTPKKPTRIGIELESPLKTGSVTLTITPE